MNQVHQMNVDYRHLNPLHESTQLALTNGQTTKYITNNFHNAVYAFVLALFRANNASNTYLDSFNQQNNVYFQDSGSNSLSNGIQWTDADLRLSVYQDHFPNTMTQQTSMNDMFHCLHVTIQ